jgi:hypothetical protein
VSITAVIGDVGASGGYWLACAGEQIFANRLSIVGSIGVITGGFGLDKFIARYEIERRLFTAGENKARMEMFSPLRPEDVAFTTELLDQAHAMFKSWVRESRGVRLISEAVFDGGYMLGERALALGLIDGLSDVDAVVRQLGGDKAKAVWIKPRARGLLRFFTRSAVESVLEIAEERLMGPNLKSGRQYFFFEKKKQKTFDCYGPPALQHPGTELRKVFGSFFKKNGFLPQLHTVSNATTTSAAIVMMTLPARNLTNLSQPLSETVSNSSAGGRVVPWLVSVAIRLFSRRIMCGALRVVPGLWQGDSRGECGQGGGIGLMFLGEDAVGEGLFSVAGEDGDGGLGQDGAFVHDFCDQMDGAAVQGFAGGEDAGMGVEAGIGGEQAGVDVQHFAAPAADQIGGEQAHVAGEADDVDFFRPQDGVDGALMGLAVAAVGFGGNRDGFYAAG